MKKNFLLIAIILLFIAAKITAQPFVDVVNFNYQTFSTKYKDEPTVFPVSWKNHTDDYFLNIFIPKEFKNGNTFLFRINSEMINSTISPDSSYSKQLASLSMPLGFQFLSKNKKWKTIAMVIPKIASDFRDNAINQYNYQLGGIFIENYVVNEKLKIKAGLYYNREAFGNFYIPLVGVDWKINSRVNLYGILPTNYKMEFNMVKNKLYTGICFKSFTRSFRLSAGNNYDYVRYDEEELKIFVDCFVYKKILVFTEAGYSLGKSPIRYMYNTKDIYYNDMLYTPTNPYPIFNVGIAYRIRQDLEKIGENK
jgi:hypothetical protein